MLRCNEQRTNRALGDLLVYILWQGGGWALSDARDNFVGDLFQRPRNSITIRSGRTHRHAADADVLQTLDQVKVGCRSGGDLKAVELAIRLAAFLFEQSDQAVNFSDEVDCLQVGIYDRHQRVKAIAIAGGSPRRLS